MQTNNLLDETLERVKGKDWARQGKATKEDSFFKRGEGRGTQTSVGDIFPCLGPCRNPVDLFIDGGLLIFSWFSSLFFTHPIVLHRTDRQTDGRMDGQIDWMDGSIRSICLAVCSCTPSAPFGCFALIKQATNLPTNPFSLYPFLILGSRAWLSSRMLRELRALGV